jgi:putative ABC transport system substrate-binding protein
MMNRRAFLCGLTLGTLSVTSMAEPQPLRKVPLVGVLHSGVPDPAPPAIVALREGLRELGYIDGQNISLDYRRGRGKVETLASLAADLVRLKVDVLYAAGPQTRSRPLGYRTSRDYWR